LAVLAPILCSFKIDGAEPPLKDSLDDLLDGTGLEVSADPSLADPAYGEASPLPISEPAPLEVGAGALGPVELPNVVQDEEQGVEDHSQRETAESSQAATRTVEVIRERYPNRNVKIEREVTQDDEGNYVNHGSWKMWDERGNLVAEGRYDLGARTGRWTRWHRRDDSPLFNVLPFSQAQGPFISQATFQNDALDGDWVIYDSKQRQLSRIGFANGQRHGPAVLWLPTGQAIRQMHYTDGELDGDVMELNKEGKLVKTAIFQKGRQLIQKTTQFKGTRNRQTEAVYLVAKLVIETSDDFWNARFAEYEKVGQDER
jgi:antitoxin component YwqK of YwqJK toxin-antitoxin module